MPNQTVQIRATRLVDGISTYAKNDQAILGTDGRIDAVGHHEEITEQTPPDAEVIDLGNAYLTPGLIDGHTHLSLAGDGRNYVQMFSETDEMMVLTGAMNLQPPSCRRDYNHSRTRGEEQGRVYTEGRA